MSEKRFLTTILSLEEAIGRVSRCIGLNLEKISVEIEEAVDCILAEDVIADFDIPPCPRAEMDGYAVKSKDLINASPRNPVKLKLSLKCTEKSCTKINTGQCVPDGYDAVCMEEYTRKEDDYILFYKQVAPGENITPAGGDVKKGELILSRGKVLTEFDIALLASLNKRFIKVYRKPFFGILNVGSELIPLGGGLTGGKRVNSNEIMLTTLMKKLGLTPIKLGIARDDPKEIRERIEMGLRLCDILFVTGGTAVSEEDLVYGVLSEIGRVIVRGIAIKPGRHTGFAIVNNRPVFVLSGNPVACAVGFLFFALPAIEKPLNLRILRFPTVKARVLRKIPGSIGYKSLVRVKLVQQNGDIFAEPISIHGAGILTTLTSADGFVIVPEDIEGFEKGEIVDVVAYEALKL